MRVLVTGGKGFIGTNLIEQILVDQRYAVTSFDILDGQDICDASRVVAEMSDTDVVVHLAAETGVVDSANDPSKVIYTNVNGTLTVLQSALMHRVQKVIFASSGALFAKQLSIYGASKAAGEALCRAFCDTYGLNVVILRLGNVYGPHSFHKTSVVHKFIRQLLDNLPMTIRGNGLQTRSFVYVSDVVDAMMDAIEYDKDEFGSGKCKVAHITSKNSYHIIDIASTLAKIAAANTNRLCSIQLIDPVNEPESVQFDPTYNAKVSIEEGLYKTWKWYTGASNGQQRH